MTNILLAILIFLTLLILVMLLVQRKGNEQEQLWRSLEDSMKRLELLFEQLGKSLKDDFQRSRSEGQENFAQNRMELGKSLETFQGRLEKMRETIEVKLKDIQLDNSKKLEEMRRTVDEKLQETLNKRINDSFKVVSERLEQVHKGLGEMQELATGVGDLKKVLSNVKTRGILGEVQLGNILEQFLSPEQYVKNAMIRGGSTEAVEFAVKLPGGENQDEEVLLPVDSKFPVEDYQRLTEMYEKVELYSREEVQKAEKQFDTIVRKSAQTISDKYIDPPVTTNFALMFVPTEGLYAQILSRTGLFEALQRDFSITVVGPSNLVAFLSSLQMGFRTLAVQKRSNEVWQILGAVKKEFGNFEKVLRKAQNQLSQASSNIDNLVGTRTRQIQRRLKGIQELPGSDARNMLGLNESDLPESEGDEESDG
ncbi:MAG: DNA recombination protein RmuC, partial [Bacteroidales bacterium]